MFATPSHANEAATEDEDPVMVERPGQKGPVDEGRNLGVDGEKAKAARRRGRRQLSPESDGDLAILDEEEADEACTGPSYAVTTSAIASLGNNEPRKEGEGEGTPPGHATKTSTATGQSERKMSGRQQSFHDYMGTLSVTPPPASQIPRRDTSLSSRSRPGAHVSKFATIHEAHEQEDTEEEVEYVTASQRQRSTAKARPVGADKARGGRECERGRSGSVYTGRGSSRDEPLQVVEDDGEEDEDGEGDIQIISDSPARGRRTELVDLTQESEDVDPAFEDAFLPREPTLPLTPTYARAQHMTGPRNLADLPDRQLSLQLDDTDGEARAYLPEGMESWGLPADELDPEVQRALIESSVPPSQTPHLDGNATARNPALASHSRGPQQERTVAGYTTIPVPTTRLGGIARPPLLAGDGAPAANPLQPLRTHCRRPAYSAYHHARTAARVHTEDTARTQQDIEDRLPRMSLDDIRAISEPLGINSTAGSTSHPGEQRMPAIGQARDLLGRIHRGLSQLSSSESSSGSSGKRKSLDEEEEEEGRGKRKVSQSSRMNRGISIETGGRGAGEDRREVLRRERGLRVEGAQLDLPGLRNVDKIADTEHVKVEIGSELVYELVFQRFIILALYRYQGVDDSAIRDVLERPYFSDPWDRLRLALRDAADHSFGSYGARKRQGYQIEPRSWAGKLIGLPFITENAVAAADSTKCQLCDKSHGDRRHFAALQLWGRHYDDVTFIETELSGGMDEEILNVGSTCRLLAVTGHRMFHSLYVAFHDFETKYFEVHVEKDQGLLEMVKDRDVNGVTAHFRDDQHTGRLKNGRRGLGERTIQQQIIHYIKRGYEDYLTQQHVRPEDLALLVRRIL